MKFNFQILDRERPSYQFSNEENGGFAAGVTTLSKKDNRVNEDWYRKGYEKGYRFARNESDYDELAAVCRAGGIPPGWDLYRAEILNQHLGTNGFDFQAYDAGFTRACNEFFEKI